MGYVSGQAEKMRKWWRSLSPEEKAILAAKQSLGAKRMWATRSEAERKAIGQKTWKTRKAKEKKNGKG